MRPTQVFSLALLASVALAPACRVPTSRLETDENVFRVPRLLAARRHDQLRRALELDAETRARLEGQLLEAWTAWERDPSERNAIWVGRRMAYLGLYQESIWWYDARVEEFPESYRLRRHQGHRYISVRMPQLAILELEEALALAEGQPNELEQDGMPNDRGIPTSTTHGNIGYHVALAHYLEGDFDAAAAMWRRCATEWAMNDDARVASVHWLYTSLVRADRPDEAREALAIVPAAPDVIENFAYRDLIELYKGERSADELLAAMDDPSQDAGRTYGVARYLIANGEEARGQALLTRLAEDGSWASFGRIAAEADVRRR